MLYLILGGNGYLGSKVINKLLENENNSIICTTRKSSDIFRIERIINNKTNRIKIIDANSISIEKEMKENRIDWILNMAGKYSRGNTSYRNITNANIIFSLEVLNLGIEYGIHNILTIGTGLPDELNLYSYSKSCFSSLGKIYTKDYNINFFNMQLQMFYGADEPQNRFIPNCILNMLKGVDIDITLGTQKRDIIAVEDVVKIILRTIEMGWKGYFDIPVGTGVAPTIREIVEYIHQETNSSSKINYGAIPMRDGEPDCIANINIINKMGIENLVYWKKGIKNMIYCMEELKNETID